MITNHLKIAYRNLVRTRINSIINIIGLSAGMATAVLIGIWAWNELSFNKYHRHYDRIARVMQHQTNQEVYTLKAMPIPAAAELRNSFKEDFERVVLSSWTNPHNIAFKDKSLSAKGNFMEAEAPEMLTLKMKYGTRAGLQDPYSIILSSSLSKAVFGEGNPVNKLLTVDSFGLKVTGVFEDLPPNSSFHEVSFIASWSIYSASDEVKAAADDWNANSFQLFAQVAQTKTVAEVSGKIVDIKFNQLDQEGKHLKPQVFLHPMSRWHLYDEFKNGINIGGGIRYVWLFLTIGGFILLLACINFMNLSTARSQRRAKEVGIRKAIGSLRSQLVTQFFGESIFLTVLAFGCSLVLVQLSLPFFNEVAGRSLVVPWSKPLFWVFATAFIFLTGLLAGSYPALYLSSFQPAKVLKGTFRVGRAAPLLRRALVVLQFTISIIMIIGTIAVFKQVQYGRSRPTGYHNEGLVLIRPYTENFHTRFTALRDDLIASGYVTEIAESGNQITQSSRVNGGYNWKGKKPSMADEFSARAVSAGYGKTISWQVLAGRDFTATPADSFAMILNESAVKYMGLTNPIGETITLGENKFTVVGLVKDIVAESPYSPVKPTLYYFLPQPGYLNVRLKPEVNIREAMSRIETICKKYSPGSPFDYKFVSDEFASKFAEEMRIGRLTSTFAILAILISCLGLFALASFVAEQRTREIGVRKVFGASSFTVWKLLSKEFVALVMISLIIAIPAANHFIRNWLQQYPIRAHISWWIFGATGLGAMMIALVTVSVHTLKTAVRNPVVALRSE